MGKSPGPPQIVAAMLLIVVGCHREAPPVTKDAGLFLPETIGAISLGQVDDFPPEFREAAAAVALRLTQNGKQPAYSFAQVARRSDDEIVVHVWPGSMFGAAKPQGGGGSSWHFSQSTHKIVRVEKWQ